MQGNWYGLLSALKIDRYLNQMLAPNASANGMVTDTALDQLMRAARISDPALNGIVGAEKPDFGPWIFTLSSEAV